MNYIGMSAEASTADANTHLMGFPYQFVNRLNKPGYSDFALVTGIRMRTAHFG
jgi:hypothetical protein